MNALHLFAQAMHGLSPMQDLQLIGYVIEGLTWHELLAILYVAAHAGLLLTIVRGGC